MFLSGIYIDFTHKEWPIQNFLSDEQHSTKFARTYMDHMEGKWGQLWAFYLISEFSYMLNEDGTFVFLCVSHENELSFTLKQYTFITSNH